MRIRDGLSGSRQISSQEVDELIADTAAVEKKRPAGKGWTPSARLEALRALAATPERFEPEGWTKLNAFLKERSEQPASTNARVRNHGLAPLPQEERAQLVARRLDIAADNGINGHEIAAIEKELSKTMGPELARDSLLAALGVRVGELAPDGLTWLQEHHGNMEKHIDRFQAVLQTHIPNARLLDSNFNGQIDETDKVLIEGADGKFTIQNVGAALRDRVRIGAAIVEACEEMAQAHHELSSPKSQPNGKFNPAIWGAPNVDGAHALKKGIKPSEAIEDLFRNPDEYAFDCGGAIVIVHYRALLKLLGPKNFDAAFPNLVIGAWNKDDKLREMFRGSKHFETGSPFIEATPERRAQLRAGDYAYYNNWDASQAALDGSWRGENVIYLGNGRFYGHPMGIKTEKEIVTFLNSQRFIGAKRSASLTEKIAPLSSQVLEWDKTPDD